MGRRRFDRAFKLEAVNLVRERGVSAAQAARDLDVHENVLRKWVKELPPILARFWGRNPAFAAAVRSRNDLDLQTSS